MKRLIPSYGAKVYDNGLRTGYEDCVDYEFTNDQSLIDLEKGLENPYNPNADDPGKPQTPRMSYSELQTENKFPNPSKEALAYVSSKDQDDNRMIPTFKFEPASLDPSEASQLINDATKLDDNHLVTFAKIELERMKSEGRIKSIQPLDEKYNSVRPPLIQKNGFNPATATASSNAQEKNLIDAFDNLSRLFPTIEESLLMSKDQQTKTEFIQRMVNRAANKVYDIPGAVKAPPLHMTPEIFVSYLVVLTKFVSNRHFETSFVAIDGLRVVVKAFSSSSSSSSSPPSSPSSSSLSHPTTKLAPLSSLTSPLPPPDQASSIPPQKTVVTNSSVNNALFLTVPALLKRLSAHSTPKEMKQAACKAILSICKSPSIKGIDATVPFLGSSKFPLQRRLFVLKLLTKEFGLEGEAKVLNCPMIMNVAIGALMDIESSGRREKIQRSAVTLIVAASLSVGKERVNKYFRLKKVPEETQTYLNARIDEGEAKRHVKEKKKAKKRLLKEQIKKFKDGEERRQSMADNIFSPDFKSQTTYFSTVGPGEDDDLFSSASSSDNDDEEK